MVAFSRFLRCFDEVARQGSIRKAAEYLHVSPSAIDRQILQAEEELKTPLFERVPSGMRLTVAGEHLVSYARRWKSEFNRAKEEIAHLGGLEGGCIRLATTEALAGDLLAQHLATFTGLYPGVQLEVQVSLTNVLEKVVLGDADIGLSFNTPTSSILTHHSVDLAIGAVVPVGHAFATRKSVSLQECADFPVILPATGLVLRSRLETAAKEAKIKLNYVASTNHFSLIRSLIMRGMGVGYLTKLEVLADVRAGKVAFVDLSDEGISAPCLSLITTAALAPAAKTLVSSLVTMLDSIKTAS